MKNKKHLKIIDIIGIVLILIGTGMVFVANDSPYHSIFQLVLAFGLVVNIFSWRIRKQAIKSSIKNKTLILALFFSSFGVMAQDYSKQIEAFTKSFADKNTKALAPYMSASLQFGKIPAANTSAIMKNIVTNLPKLNSMAIIESEERKAKVAYDFVGFGKSESFIHFDAEGKIIKIQLVEDLINQEAEARRQQKVPLPTPGALGNKYSSTQVEFPARDGLVISGNLYEIDKNKSIILLMHQAGYNRMEYADIAPKLNELGYNCLAIDLRSGGSFAGKPNNTNTRAIEKGLQPEMIDAQQDVATAIDYLHNKYNQNIIVLGSSFSSSLALLEGYNNSKVKAIIGFSPGDYFGDIMPSLSSVFSKTEKPYLVTSSKTESETLKALIGNSQLKENQLQFIPTSSGFHGSRALWEGQEGAEEYWQAVKTFLITIKKNI